MSVHQDEVAFHFTAIAEDERWQGGLDDDERRILLNGTHELLILALQRSWDLPRMSKRIKHMLLAFREQR